MTVYTRGASHTVVDACVPIINSLGEWNKMFPLETISNDNLALLRNFETSESFPILIQILKDSFSSKDKSGSEDQMPSD